MDLEKLFRRAADRQAFSDPKDELSEMIERYGAGSDELDVTDLEFVAAAGGMDYQRFMERVKARKRDR